MFTQQKSLFRFTKAIALVILLCFTFIYQAQGEKAVKEKAKDVAEITAQKEYDYVKGFKEEVESRLADLETYFENSKFNKMAELLGDNTVLVTPQGVRLKGEDSLSNFWKEQKDREVTEVSFTSKYQHATKVAVHIEQGLDTIEHVGHAIIDYRLITNNGGGTLTNKTGTLALNLRHPRKCTWDN